MDWIDEVIRDICELPDRSSPDDDPDAIIATAAEIRAAIETNCPYTEDDAQVPNVELTGGALAPSSDQRERG